MMSFSFNRSFCYADASAVAPRFYRLRKICFFAVSQIVLCALFFVHPAVAEVPGDIRIREILQERVQVERSVVGIVVGVIDRRGRRIVSYGLTNNGEGQAINGDTIFEIGSIAKIFTALLLTDLVRRGEVKLSDPVARCLPSGVVIPKRNGRVISLIDLATHTSGLPRMPSDFPPPNISSDSASYSMQKMYRFLSGYSLPRDIGVEYEYSNLGFSLLGDALSKCSGQSYEALVQNRILKPLQMKNTFITPTPLLRKKLASGHNIYLEPVPSWISMVGAGGMHSSTNDMLSLLAAFLGYTNTPLSSAMKATYNVRRPILGTERPINDTAESALGWVVFSMNGKKLVGKAGLTAGFSGYLVFDPEARIGIVVLSNTADQETTQSIGNHLIDPSETLKPSSPRRKQITLNSAVYDRFVGRYMLQSNRIFEVTRDGRRLIGEIEGEGKAELFPESATDFFIKSGDVQVSFIVDSSAKAEKVIMKIEGKIEEGKRLRLKSKHIQPR